MKTLAKLREIQQGEENIRRRWFWGLLFFFGLISVFIWGIYIQSALPKTKNAAEVEISPKISEISEGEGFFSVLGKGLQAIGKQAETGWQTLGGKTSSYFSELQNLIQKERSVDFQPESDLEFAPVPVEEIPAAALPGTN